MPRTEHARPAHARGGRLRRPSPGLVAVLLATWVAPGLATAQMDVPPPAPPMPDDAAQAERLEDYVKRLEPLVRSVVLDDPDELPSAAANRRRLNLALGRMEQAICEMEVAEDPTGAQLGDALKLIHEADRDIARVDEELLNDAERRVLRDAYRLRNRATETHLASLQARLAKLEQQVQGRGPGPNPGPVQGPNPVQGPVNPGPAYPNIAPNPYYYYPVQAYDPRRCYVAPATARRGWFRR
jgi:hypothetical protein